jgi:hypothetical protein
MAAVGGKRTAISGQLSAFSFGKVKVVVFVGADR